MVRFNSEQKKKIHFAIEYCRAHGKMDEDYFCRGCIFVERAVPNNKFFKNPDALEAKCPLSVTVGMVESADEVEAVTQYLLDNTDFEV